MDQIEIKTEFIKLDQFLKWIGIVESGVRAKELIVDGKVSVNKIIEKRRGKKLFIGDVVSVLGNDYIIK